MQPPILPATTRPHGPLYRRPLQTRTRPPSGTCCWPSRGAATTTASSSPNALGTTPTGRWNSRCISWTQWSSPPSGDRRGIRRCHGGCRPNSLTQCTSARSRWERSDTEQNGSAGRSRRSPSCWNAGWNTWGHGSKTGYSRSTRGGQPLGSAARGVGTHQFRPADSRHGAAPRHDGGNPQRPGLRTYRRHRPQPVRRTGPGPMTVMRPATGGRRWPSGKVDTLPFQTAYDSGKIGSTRTADR